MAIIWLSIVTIGLWLWFAKRRSFGLAVLSVAAFMSVIGSTPVPYILLARLEKPYLGNTIGNCNTADAVFIVLDAQKGTVGESFELGSESQTARMVTALEIVREGKAKEIVLVETGSGSGGAQIERWLRSWQIKGVAISTVADPETSVALVNRIKRVAKSRQWKNEILVASAYSLGRYEQLFQSSGMHWEYVACGFKGIGASRPRAHFYPSPERIRDFDVYLSQ